MGCCLSTYHQAKDSSFRENANLPASHLRARDPPPDPEVETVKEVLSETPNPRPRVDEQQGWKRVAGDAAPKLRDERSEDDSVSESFSVQTRATEKRCEEVDAGEQRPRPRSPAKLQKKRSFSGELSCKRERCAAGVAGGRLRKADGRTMSARETGLRSRDLGERSGRRSMSPAAKQRAGGGQCRSLSAPRSSPRRVPPKRAHDAQGGGGLEAKESLENPSVSLECFIFL
ncbi:hypothetical protein J5N97_006139 [Dioscorea zingiberensis]|uniref:Serine/arginine repetitive matrix protein 1-like n=1 Tax=Dioscorea zingiberensis TaxID=325984 RepID=A0A9D5HT30_9LILI|nr:hypothetical protein J5N97_006139 [Dioscorea zingiberensis]